MNGTRDALAVGASLRDQRVFAGSIAAQDSAQIERGRTLYEYWCATCHGPGIGNNGAQHLPGTDACA